MYPFHKSCQQCHKQLISLLTNFASGSIEHKKNYYIEGAMKDSNFACLSGGRKTESSVIDKVSKLFL